MKQKKKKTQSIPSFSQNETIPKGHRNKINREIEHFEMLRWNYVNDELDSTPLATLKHFLS